VQPCVQIQKPCFEIFCVLRPGHPVHASRRLPMKSMKDSQQTIDGHVVEQLP
jgi:hypothetical protein